MHGKTLFSHAPVQQHNHNLQRWVKTSQNLRWFFLPCPAGGKWPVETKGWRMVVLMEKEEQSENTKPLNGMAADQWLWRTPRHPPWGYSGLTQGNKALRSQKRRTRQVGRAQGPPPECLVSFPPLLAQVPQQRSTIFHSLPKKSHLGKKLGTSATGSAATLSIPDWQHQEAAELQPLWLVWSPLCHLVTTSLAQGSPSYRVLLWCARPQDPVLLPAVPRCFCHGATEGLQKAWSNMGTCVRHGGKY